MLRTLFMQEISHLLMMPPVVWVGVLLFLPLLCMLYVSFGGIEHFTFAHYLKFIDPTYLYVICRSFFLASCTAFFTLLIGFPVAYYVAIHAHTYKTLLLFLLSLPFWTNLIVQVYAWFFILEREGILNTLLLKLNIIDAPIQFAYNLTAVVVIMVYCYLPFMIMPLYTVLQKLDTQLLEASMDLGATAWQTFWHITVPLTLSGIKTGLLLVFVPAFGDFVIPGLIGGGRYLTVGSLISYYFLTAQNMQAGAAFTLLNGLILASCIGCIYSIKKLRMHNKEQG